MANKMNILQYIKTIAIELIFYIVQYTCGVLLWVIYGGPGEKIPPINDLLLLDSATTLAYKIRTRKIKSVDVVKSFIERIKSINPILNCVVDDRFTDALETAQEVDEYLRTTNDSIENIARDKPFLGVPITIKECLSVENHNFTVGLDCRRGLKADKDAAVVDNFKKSGAIPIALTNVPELCMWWETSNNIYGRTKNPYNTNCIPGGSSGGEGSVLAAAGSPMGVGTDIGGSVRIPAFFTGIFSHKHTLGMVPLQGIYPPPANENQYECSSIGPMSRFAGDLLPMMKVLSSNNKSLRLDDRVDITKLKFYYMEDAGKCRFVTPVDKEIKNCVKKIVEYLDKTYNIKAVKLNVKKMKDSAGIWFAKMKTDDEKELAERLTEHHGKVNIFLEPFKVLLRLSKHTMPLILMCYLERYYSSKYGSDEYNKYIEMGNELRKELEEILNDDGILIYPTHPTSAPYHLQPLVKPFNFIYTGIFNALGFPATHCPMGLDSKGLPIGVQVISSRNQDRLTLAVAVELEKAFGGWVPPTRHSD